MNLENEHRVIADDLRAVETVVQTQLLGIGADEAMLEQAFHAFFQGRGKKLRPRLVLLSAFALRGPQLRDRSMEAQLRTVTSLGAIVELVHSASLMHDDVLDRAATRRGHPSMNAHFGDKLAILAGDILYSQAFKLLVQTSDSATTLMLIDCVSRMCRGEVTALSGSDFESYQQIIDDKTASLMQFCCKAAVEAVRDPADSPDVLDAFEQFGYSFGMVYQLADDLFDQDVEIAVSNRDMASRLLDEHVEKARATLTLMPTNSYSDGLEALLNFVLAEVSKLQAVA